MHIKATYILILVCALSCIAKAQTPANDANWQIDTAMSDEFNGKTIDTAKWHVLDCPSGDCCNWGGSTSFQKGNTFDSSGILNLRSDGPGEAPIPCNGNTFPTGGITSHYANYSYGYFEIYAKLPGFIDGSGIAHADKYWPTFWMAYNPICSIHNEIDIMDECCCYYGDAETTGSGWGQAGKGVDSCSPVSVGFYMNKSPVPLCSGFHKFAVEWNTDRIIYYRDDVPYFENYNSPSFTMNPQKIYIDLQLSSTCNFYPGMPFPQYMQVDYFRYYKMKLDCSNSVTLLTNTDLAGYNFAVESDITLGNGLNLISLLPGSSSCFRAVNSITINGSFTAPLGSELVLMPTACN